MALVAAAGQDHVGHPMTMDAATDSSPGISEPSAPAPDRGLLGLAGMCLAVLLLGSPSSPRACTQHDRTSVSSEPGSAPTVTTILLSDPHHT